MRHIMLAVAASVAITAGALTAPVAAASSPPEIAWDVAYVMAFRAEALWYNVLACPTASRCTAIYDAPADLDGHDVFVRDTYTIKMTSRTSAEAIGTTQTFSVISQEQLYTDMHPGVAHAKSGLR
jgi:hypothetical protein